MSSQRCVVCAAALVLSLECHSQGLWRPFRRGAKRPLRTCREVVAFSTLATEMPACTELGA